MNQMSKRQEENTRLQQDNEKVEDHSGLLTVACGSLFDR
jgi:hypothetical protein